MNEVYLKYIADSLNLKTWMVENCIGLLSEGATIPFISRYRKEKTGGMDDAQVSCVKSFLTEFEDMDKRKQHICKVISESGNMTSELLGRINECVSSSELEDIYLPFKPKRKTKASAAREKGLEKLAGILKEGKARDLCKAASSFLTDEVPTVEDALQGARDIMAEEISENGNHRKTIREILYACKLITSPTKQGKEEENTSKYKACFNISEPVSRIPAHRILAILRAESEGYINYSLNADTEKCVNKLYYDYCKENGYPSQEIAVQVRMALDDSFKRLLLPSVTNQVMKELKLKADKDSIEIFGENLKQLLLAPPLGQKKIMAIDPGYRNGCKIACIDKLGNPVHHTVIYPHPPANQKIDSIKVLTKIIEEFEIEAIAIGNGTASRETEEFIKKLELPKGCAVFLVSEDGASVYSASETGREEFPDEDVTVRGAVSIARRLMDPLAELVKIDPKSLGIGQYQHDVDQKLLKEKLDTTVLMCVNTVGVELNTAGVYLLRYVSGLNSAAAGNIVKYRNEFGGFKNRNELLKVPKLGIKTFEQCAGFLRIGNSDNPLDNSAVHPESYGIVEKMASDLNAGVKDLIGNESLLKSIEREKYVTEEFGLPTINYIITELGRAGRDVRNEAEAFSFEEGIRSLEDLYEGMRLPGIVTNITDFGAFVNIGLHENGLIHVSQMGKKGIHPTKILKLQQHVNVKVINVDLERKRISLSLLL